VGRLWVAGVDVDWSGFYANERRHRIPLPTYPFERQRYWVEPQRQPYGDGTQSASLYKRPDIADWFYIPSWKRSVPPQVLNRGAFPDDKAHWLVFIDECGLGPQIVQRLKQQGQDVISVRVGEKFSKVSEALYTLNPQTRDDYDVLIKELLAVDKAPNKIVQLWNVTPRDHRSSGIEFFEKSQYLGFYSLLFLVQALGEQLVKASLQVDVISNHMQEVNGEALLCPEKATVMGPCKVIPQEYPNITCRSIDIVFPANGKEDTLIGQLLAELTSKLTDLVVAYRGKHRWVQTFEPIQLNETANKAPRLREGGVYLITGGLGGMGLVFAEYLAKTLKAKLILTGRSTLPAREQWGEWLKTHEESEGTSRKIRKVRELEDLGAEVLTVSADVADLGQMQNVITQATERFGAIHGVIHAAGVAGGGIISLKAPEIAAAILAPKVKGTLVLDTLLRDLKPDFFVLCSSISSILPPPGQVDYCGANAFLDAFAHCHNSNDGTFVVSVDWDTWQEVGMVVDTEVPDALKKQREESLKKGILSCEGIDAFRRILGCHMPQLLVGTRNLKALIDQRTTLDSFTETVQPKEVQSTPLQARPNLPNQYVAPKSEVQQTIARIWQELLGIDHVGIHDNLIDLGAHSLLAIEAISRIHDAFKVKVSLRILLEATTVAELAERIETVLWAAQGNQSAPRGTDNREEIEL
jgi:NAD(P)-dependent dehydrogenase (short-subunit alcohol dehydrogenase family)/acyl carrier protein